MTPERYRPEGGRRRQLLTPRVAGTSGKGHGDDNIGGIAIETA